MANYQDYSSSREMEQLDPSPFEEEPPVLDADIKGENVVNPEDLSPDSHPSYFPPSRSTTNSVGISSSRVPSILLSLQKYSTLPPALYLIGHYANTALIPLFTQSTASAEKSLLLTRPYYQSFPLEPLLIFLPIVTHVASGLSLRVYRRFQAAKRYGAETHAERRKISKNLWPRLTLTSALGYALYPMMVAHVIVNRVTPLKVHGDSSSVGLRFFSHGIQRHPWLASIGYTVMVSVASWHFVGGAAKYLRLTREYVTEGGDYGASKRRTRSLAVNAVSAVVAALWALGGLAVIGRGVGAPIPSAWEVKQWEEVYKAVPVVGGMM
jgi:succinate dehydrogenase/fumarate reductase cytochrome b subunit